MTYVSDIRTPSRNIKSCVENCLSLCIQYYYFYKIPSLHCYISDFPTTIDHSCPLTTKKPPQQFF